jgi:hypothetical protein
MRLTHLALFSCLGTVCAQELVIPPEFAAKEAPSAWWLPGLPGAFRQQILVDASLLQPILGHTITAVSFRRNGGANHYRGGSAQVTACLSTSPRTVTAPAADFAANHGADLTTVYQGVVTAPTPQAPVSMSTWTTDNIVRIAFTSTFAYAGGTLCLDLDGAAVAGNEVQCCFVDAVDVAVSATVVQRGNGCGVYGGPTHGWAMIDEQSLVPGGTARFSAFGQANAPAILLLAGAFQQDAVPLAPYGAASDCFVHLNTLLGTVPTSFVPPLIPNSVLTEGLALAKVQLPAETWLLGACLASQWLDLGQFAVSNADEWTISSQVPALPMARVAAFHQQGAAPASGDIDLTLAPVVRFEFQ